MGKIKVAASPILSRIKKVLIAADVDGFQPVRTVTSIRVSEKRASLNDRLLIVFESDIFLSCSSRISTINVRISSLEAMHLAFAISTLWPWLPWNISALGDANNERIRVGFYDSLDNVGVKITSVPLGKSGGLHRNLHFSREIGETSSRRLPITLFTY